MVNIPATKSVLEETDSEKVKKSGRDNDRTWDATYTIEDSTLQTFYDGDLLDENTEAGRA